MSRIIRLKIAGDAENLFDELNKQEFTDGDVIAQALGLLKEAHDTRRVALLKKGVPETSLDQYVEVIYEVPSKREDS